MPKETTIFEVAVSVNLFHLSFPFVCDMLVFHCFVFTHLGDTEQVF
uniref:Uncharacterized protein n=1 Tax=Arundo donax TaxID=35708 RepID=A0A0A9C8H8_ARUDO